MKKSLNSIKSYCENLNSAIGIGLNGVGAGSAASGATGKGAFDAAMAGKSIGIEDIEDKIITH